MGAVSPLAAFQNFILPVHKINKSSLAFTGKLNQKRFPANLTLKWNSAVYLKLTKGKRFNLAWAGLLRLYLLCDVLYFCHVKEDTALALFEFYKYKNVPV